MSKEFKLGLFVIIVSAVFLFFTINMENFFSKGNRTVKIYFKEISTLEVGAPVKQKGFDVGEVTARYPEIVRDEDKPEIFIVVEARVSDDAMIAKDSEASIQTLGMMGEKYIEISFGTIGGATGVTVIKGRGPQELDKIFESAVVTSEKAQEMIEAFTQIINHPDIKENLPKLITNIEGISANINDLLGGEKTEIKSIVENLQIASANLNSIIATSEILISDIHSLVKKNEEHISQTLENTAIISQEVRDTVVSDMKVMSGQLKAMAANINESACQANQLMAKLSGAIDDASPEVKDILNNITGLSENAKSAAQRMDNILNQVENENGFVHDLIYDKELSEFTKETVQSSAAFFDDVKSIPDRFSFAAEFTYFSDRPRFDNDDNHFRTDMGVQFDISEAMYVYAGANGLGASNDLEAQFGYWLGPVALHGGIIESEFGLGIDWRVFDRFIIGAEGVGLTDRHEERLDVYGEILLLDYLSFIGGAQDITDEIFPYIGMKAHF